MHSDILTLAGWAAVLALLIFSATWLVARRVDNYSFVDAAWAYSLVILVVQHAVLAHGSLLRRELAVVLAAVWSLRLGTYLLLRILRHHPKEDIRYHELRARWKTRIPWHFYQVFLWQAALIAALSGPYLMACRNPAPAIGWIEWLGLAVAACGLIGEGVADHQMRLFKKSHQHQPKAVCTVGLWNYSRHPNYFFEFVVWVGAWLFACGSPGGWTTVYAPILMLLFLYRVTGIPLTEAHAIRSKGDAYRDYQRSTSAFVPWLKKPPTSYP